MDILNAITAVIISADNLWINFFIYFTSVQIAICILQ